MECTSLSVINILKPGHCPEIPEILKVVLKCPDIQFVLNFLHVLKFVKTPVMFW